MLQTYRYPEFAYRQSDEQRRGVAEGARQAAGAEHLDGVRAAEAHLLHAPLADHVHVVRGDDLRERDGRMVDEPAGAEEPRFLALVREWEGS